MTVPWPENVVIWKGTSHSTYASPLEEYFKLHPPRPNFSEFGFYSRSGYNAEWVIENDHLYLTKICNDFDESEGAKLDDGSRLTLRSIFPTNDGPVFAKWFSGEIIFDDGSLVMRTSVGSFPIYERTHILEISNGVLTGDRIRDNSDRIKEASAENKERMERFSLSLPKRRSGFSRFWNPNHDDSELIKAISKLLDVVMILLFPVAILALLVAAVCVLPFKIINRIRK